MAEVVEETGGDRDQHRPPRAGRRVARERALTATAAGQYSILTTEDLLALGLTKHAISHRVAIGRLWRLHRGVYAVGGAVVGPEGRWLAAVKACGPNAVLSHLSAAALWRLRENPRGGVDITGPGSRHSRPGIRVHRSRQLGSTERTERDGIPVTTVAQTLLDLAGLLSERSLERAVIEAERERVLDRGAVERLCRPGRRGAGRLRGIVRRELGPWVGAASELEMRFLDLCREHAIPMPQVNVLVAGFRVDAYWPAPGLVVELDGRAYHRTAGDRRRDTARDGALRLAGLEVVRFDWGDVTKRSAATARRVLTSLAT